MRIIILVLVMFTVVQSARAQVLDDEAMHALEGAFERWKICPDGGECRSSRDEIGGTVLIWTKWRPEMAQLSPEERRWFRQQRITRGPAKGNSCCSEADGTYAQEDIRDGHYWTRFHYGSYNEIGAKVDAGETDWMEVPDDAVLDTPNRHGSPAVWYYWAKNTDEKPSIRCFAPGALF
jgi:hypothetical protein